MGNTLKDVHVFVILLASVSCGLADVPLVMSQHAVSLLCVLLGNGTAGFLVFSNGGSSCALGTCPLLVVCVLEYVVLPQVALLFTLVKESLGG